MTVISPLYALVNRIGQLALQEDSDSSSKAHFEMLRMIDELRLAVETPTETVLRLIYQVRAGMVPQCSFQGWDCRSDQFSLRKMLLFVWSWI